MPLRLRACRLPGFATLFLRLRLSRLRLQRHGATREPPPFTLRIADIFSPLAYAVLMMHAHACALFDAAPLCRAILHLS